MALNEVQPQVSGQKGVFLQCVIEREWTPELEAYFIEEVFKNRHLWDFKHPLYTKKSAKKAGYETISRLMKTRWPYHRHLMNSDSLMRKFSKLKTYFIKECRKSKQYSSRNVKFSSKWIHFKRMQFLNGLYIAFSEESSKDSNDSPVSFIKSEFVVDEAENSSEVDLSEMRVSTEALTPVPVSTKELDSVSNPPSKKIKIEKEDETLREKLPEVPPQVSSKGEIPVIVDSISLPSKVKKTRKKVDIISKEAESSVKDLSEDEKSPDEFYGKFIISELKKIKDPRKRDLARLDIQNVIMKYKYMDDT